MKKTILITLLLIVLTSSLFGQSFYNADITFNGTHTDNLYKNSSDASDYFSSTKASINIYPLPFSQLNLLTEYKNYHNNDFLSNLNYGAGITLLPLSDSSKFSIYVNMNYKGYNYKDDTITTNSSEFSDININGSFALGYQINEITNIRTGLNYTLTGYSSEFVADKKPYDIFTGINFSIFGKNSIDFEGGYTFEKYDYLPEFDPSVPLGYYPIRSTINAYELLQESDLNSYYISIRYSRPIFVKTGISMSYSYRKFSDLQDSAILLGSTTGYLSPWVSSYDGNSMQAKIKTYLIPYTIINIGGGYWNSKYLKTVETISDSFGNVTHTRNAQNRHDDKYRFFITFTTPIVTSSGRLIEPSLSLDYTDNKSSIANYTYTDFTVSLSINLR